MSMNLNLHGVTNITVTAVDQIKDTNTITRDLVITFDDGQELKIDLFGDRAEDLQVTSKL